MRGGSEEYAKRNIKQCFAMVNEAGMRHVGLKIAHSDLPHPSLVRQHEAVLDVSLRELPGCQGRLP